MTAPFARLSGRRCWEATTSPPPSSSPTRPTPLPSSTSTTVSGRVGSCFSLADEMAADSIETINKKSTALLAKVKALKAAGVPIHGVGFQVRLA